MAKSDGPDPEDRLLPANIDAERFILGSLLLDDDRFGEISGVLSEDDLHLEKHRRIYHRMIDLNERGEKIDRVTVANELMNHNELESIDGLTYLISLDEGLPHISNIDSYVTIVREKSALRKGLFLTQHTMNRFMSGKESADSILTNLQDHASEIHLKFGTSKQGDFTTPLAAIERYEGGINTFLDPSKRMRGITTGFTKLDDMTGGFRAGDYIILAARPSMGKTALALNIAWHVAWKLGLTVPVFSLEMSTESLVTRLACSEARVDSQKFRAGYISQDERMRLRSAIGSITAANLFIDDDASVTMPIIGSKLRRLKKQQGSLGMVVIDYLQLMGGNKSAENRNQEVTQMSRGCKLLAKELGCPFLVLSQLNRQTEMRKGSGNIPQLSDLRESGAIEQDADVVGFVHRPEVYDRSREDLRGVAELILAKQREGPIGKIPLVFIHSQVRFANPAGNDE